MLQCNSVKSSNSLSTLSAGERLCGTVGVGYALGANDQVKSPRSKAVEAGAGWRDAAIALEWNWAGPVDGTADPLLTTLAGDDAAGGDAERRGRYTDDDVRVGTGGVGAAHADTSGGAASAGNSALVTAGVDVHSVAGVDTAASAGVTSAASAKITAVCDEDTGPPDTAPREVGAVACPMGHAEADVNYGVGDGASGLDVGGEAAAFRFFGRAPDGSTLEAGPTRFTYRLATRSAHAARFARRRDLERSGGAISVAGGAASSSTTITSWLGSPANGAQRAAVVELARARGTTGTAACRTLVVLATSKASRTTPTARPGEKQAAALTAARGYPVWLAREARSSESSFASYWTLLLTTWPTSQALSSAAKMRLALAMNVQVLRKSRVATYTFAIEEISVERIDVLESKLRELQDKVDTLGGATRSLLRATVLLLRDWKRT
ncbi:uncharacterized protein IUM83_19824 [Phytophthora cinnamomi]|uniref:uncharacterized protein n=1 Tax=Phytophthora cinnamomi TaxID=4785 RepID=UPI00355A2E12|nr:hypothetical protein IUM83_19824 [Phytophthora cinnamomi]